jgi:dTDP-4-amino-4,6-dideoxygalactose transaminase
MTDLEASIGIEQLKKLNKLNKKRIQNAEFLNKNLGKIKGIVVPAPAKEAKHVYHQYTIRITPDFPLSRDEVLAKLTEAGIGTAVFYPSPINEQKVYQDLGYKQNTPIAEKVSKKVLSLPVHPGLKKSQLQYIVKVFQNLAKK